MRPPPPRPGKYHGLVLPDGWGAPAWAYILAAMLAGGLWAWALATIAAIAQ